MNARITAFASASFILGIAGAAIGQVEGAAPGERGARGVEAVPAAAADGVTAAFPAEFRHPLGFSLRHPANWQERTLNGTAALVPDDAPQIQGGPGEVYALAAMGRGSRTSAEDLVAFLQSDVAKSLPGLSAVGSPEIGGEGERRSVTLRYKAASQDGVQVAATVRATIRGDLIVVMMGLGVSDALRNHDELAAQVLATAAAVPRVIDEKLLGSWTNSSSYSSTGFSMASSRTYTLAADGTYSYTSRVAGGTADVSGDSGGTKEAGIWAARDGVFTKVDASGNAVRLTYKFVDRHLVVYDAGGKRTIWDR